MKKNSITEDSYSDLKELDRLVSQELEIFRQHHRKNPQASNKIKHNQRDEDNVIVQKDWKRDAANDKNPVSPKKFTNVDDFENFNPEQKYTHDLGENQQLDQASQTELFTDEEIEFIAHSITWLGSRKNKDLIINRIWDQLTESDPEKFYSVESEAHSETEDSSAEAPQNETNTQDSEESEG